MSDRIVMTKGEAEQYYWLIREIASCRQRLERLEAEVEQWDDNPELLYALSENRMIIEARMAKCERECELFETWLAAVPDPQIQSWLYSRCVDGLSWVQIATAAHMKNDTVRTAIYRFFAKEAAR